MRNWQKYPKSTWLIIFFQFCERYSYFGFRTFLVLYLTTVLKFTGDHSMIIYHSFISLVYISPLIGAMLADSFWGKFKTIIRLSAIYALGGVILAGASMIDMINIDIQKIIAVLGLFLISIGAGGIRPLCITFAGDQFKFPQQQQQFQHYIIRYILALDIGALLSSILTPKFKHGVHCFEKNSCYPLTFGVSALVIIIAVVTFIFGEKMFVKNDTEHKAFSRTFGCIYYILTKRITPGISINGLDHTKDNKYTDDEIMDSRLALNVITVFTTYPVFWALYEYQISRWKLQATLMNGRLDFLNWAINPDQMHTITPFCALLFLIRFYGTLNPLLTKIGIRKPLQKLTLSGCLATVAFIFSAMLQFEILGNSNIIPAGEGRLNIYNGFDCDVHARLPTLNIDHTIQPLGMMNVNYALVSREDIVEIVLHFDRECTFVPDAFELNTTVTVADRREISYYLTRLNTNTIGLNRVGNYDNYVKNKRGNPSLRVLVDGSIGFDSHISFNSSNGNSYSFPSSQRMYFNEVAMGKYNLYWNEQMLPSSMQMIPATFYTVTLQNNGDKTDVKVFTKYEGAYFHVLWQLPQYVFMILAVVIFAVTTLEFSFFEAPINLKTFVFAFDLLTIAVGNLLVIIISAISIENQAYEYLLYSSLMCADTFLIAYFSVVFRSRYH
ncbi:peptide transporter family 1-like isoform X2 [Sipha flava]|uniref:Peptide transporter family 1-like isoform X2 n=1 Tax=Sipha flava TaxID=143950 RepID=A0A8B8G3E1_9HEMI|nr:peptide transporter family 1-like isoform X2 [Sipha flava]